MHNGVKDFIKSCYVQLHEICFIFSLSKTEWRSCGVVKNGN
jgi:hypothetical protein